MVMTQFNFNGDYDAWLRQQQGLTSRPILNNGPQYNGTQISGIMGPNSPSGPYPAPQSGGNWMPAGPGGVRYGGEPTWSYARQGPPPSTPSGIDPQYASGQQPNTIPPIPKGPGVGIGALGPLITGQQPAAKMGLPETGAPGIAGKPVYNAGQQGANFGAAWNGQDYKLPSGETLPGWASFTMTTKDGKVMKIPGVYDPNSAAGGRPQAIFRYAQGQATAVEWLQRRLNDIHLAGGNVNDPNVMYDAVARLRDDAMVALGLQEGDPQLSAKLRAATGFVHLDRFIRAGKPGGPPGAAGAAPGATPPVASPAAPGATGGPPAVGGGPTVPEGYKGGNAGTMGNLTAAQRMELASDPQKAFRYMMQQIGLDPSKPGLLANTLRQKYVPLLEARLAASSVNDSANYMDTIGNVLNEFGSGLFEKGGNFFGNLRATGDAAAQQGQGFLNNLQDQEQAMQYSQQLGMLRYAGSNPLVQQANADEMRRGYEEYGDYSFQNEGAGQNIDPFVRWLQQQAKYRNIFGY